MKKTLAIILALALVFSSFTVAFAEEAIGTEAKAVETLGMLKGDGSGVTATYLAKTSTRIQAAIMYLRLKGLEKTALEFTGKENFSDLTKSEANNKVMAYLKANPQYGFLGVGNNKFAAEEAITAQQYYKVILEGLGYKQTTTDVVGDFEYKDTLAFAAKLGLTKAAAAKTFTNNDIAIATVEGLMAKVKGGEKTLAETLIAAGVFTEAQAITAGVYVKPVAALVATAVKATANTKVDVTLENAVKEVKAADFAIEDANKAALAVTAATLSADGKTVTLVTAAQTTGVKYTLTVNAKSFSFVGQIADTTKPTLDLANALTNTVVEATFSEVLDANALLAANYTIDGLTITGANFKVKADGTLDKKVVQLTTSAQTETKLYKLVVANVTDVAGNVINDTKDEFQFGGRGADKSKPTANTVVTALDGNKVIINFSDESLLDVATLGNVANYAIEGLTITGVEVTANELGSAGLKEVVLTTSAQTATKLYYVEVKNVADMAGNVITTVKLPFGGSTADVDKLGIVAVSAETNTTVTIEFNDLVDAATALNVANYSIEGLTVTGVAEDKDATEASNTNQYLRRSFYVLTTSAQKANNLYYLVTKNLLDDKGNAQTSSELKVPFGGKPADTTKPVASGAVSSDKNTVLVTFTEDSKLDKTSATNVFNYVFDGGLGYPTSASYDSATQIVTLKTAAQTASKSYKLSISNVADTSANVMTATDLTFVGKGDTDTAAPKVESVIALDKNTLQVVFSKKVTGAGTAAHYTISASTKSGYTLGAADIATPLADGKTVLLTYTTNPFDYGYAYDLTVANTSIVNAVDNTQKLNTTNSANIVKFAGSGAANAAPTLDAVIALDALHVKAVFSEPMKTKSSAPADFMNIATLTIVGRDAAFSGTVKATGSFQSISADGKEVTFLLSAKLTGDSVFKAYITDVRETLDLTGLSVETAAAGNESKAGVLFAASTADVPTMKVDAVLGVDEYTVDIYFNNEIGELNGGSELDTDTSFITITNQDGTTTNTPEFDHAIVQDSKVIRAYFKTNKFVQSKVYTLQINAGTAGNDLVEDVDGNLLGEVTGTYDAAKGKAIFSASGSEQPKIKVASAEAIAYNLVKVTFNQPLETGLAATDIDDDLQIDVKGVGTLAVDTGFVGDSMASDNSYVILKLVGGVFSAEDEYTVSFAGHAVIKNIPGVDTVDTTSKATFRGIFTIAIDALDKAIVDNPGAGTAATDVITQTATAKLSDGRTLANGIVVTIELGGNVGAAADTLKLTAPAAITTTTKTNHTLAAGDGTFTITAAGNQDDLTNTLKMTVKLGVKGTSYAKTITITVVAP